MIRAEAVLGPEYPRRTSGRVADAQEATLVKRAGAKQDEKAALADDSGRFRAVL